MPHQEVQDRGLSLARISDDRMLSPDNLLWSAKRVDPLGHPTRFILAPVAIGDERQALWRVIRLNPENPGRIEPADEDDTRFSLFTAGSVFVAFAADGVVVSFITGAQALTAEEATEIAAQAEVVVREAALERERLVELGHAGERAA